MANKRSSKMQCYNATMRSLLPKLLSYIMGNLPAHSSLFGPVQENNPYVGVSGRNAVPYVKTINSVGRSANSVS